MRIFLFGTFLFILGATQPAKAQDQTDSATAPTSTAEANELTKGVYDKSWSITPRVGILGYEDVSQNYTSRILEGFTTNFNLSEAVSFPTSWHLGLETGILYSYTGAVGSNLLGTNSTSPAGAGSNTFYVPMNLVFGYKPSTATLVALDVGAQMFYRSAPSSMYFGRASDLATGSQVDFFPGIGLNLGWEASKLVALSLRGDYIPTSSLGMYSATLGATFGIS